MLAIRTMVVLILGGVVIGCSGARQTPAASTPTLTDEQTIARLQQAYRSTHPGSEVGVVNATMPERRIVSVAGVPADRVHRGEVMTIMVAGQLGTNVPGVVYDMSSGYIQLRYQPLPSGQTAPKAGDLVIWFAGGPTVPPEAMQPARERAPMTPPVVPATQPPMREEIPPPPATVTTATMPAETTVPPATPPTTNPQPPAGMPASPATVPATNPQPTTESAAPATQPADLPATRAVPDLNK